MSKLENGQLRIIEELDYKKREGGEEDEKEKEYNNWKKSERKEQGNNIISNWTPK